MRFLVACPECHRQARSRGRPQHPPPTGLRRRYTQPTGAVEINHTSLARTYNVQVNTQNRDIGGVAGDIETRLRDLAKREWKEQRHVEMTDRDVVTRDGDYSFPATDPRKDEAIARRYMAGRYGGVPILSEPEFDQAAALITADAVDDT